VNQKDVRIGVLNSLGASSSERDELLAYNKNLFDLAALSAPIKLPLPDEPFASAWERYERKAKDQGALETLKDRLVQLSFPIKKGISQTDAYRSATRKGVAPEKIPEASGLALRRPNGLRLGLHPTLAGRIPVLVTVHRDDFVAVLRALTMRNEPEEVPEATGAMIVSGYNNWDRIRTLRKKWKADHADDFGGIGWTVEFQRIVSQKALYQDKFIILSDGPYSGVQGHELGISDAEWREISLVIRREHECTHYATRHLFNSMQNRLLDELIADYMGIAAAAGCFKADWFLCFMGLENFPEYRNGGRLENYRGDPPLSNGAFKLLQTLAGQAALNVERFDAQYGQNKKIGENSAFMLFALARLTIEELASKQGIRLLSDALSRNKPEA